MEIPLTGGRITKGVVKIDNFVHRPCCKNSIFVHDVLRWLEKKNITTAPKFLGIDEHGREITSFLEGYSPDNLGDFTHMQLYEAGKIIRHLHDSLSDFPGCSEVQTVCHNDLSPCNFMFVHEIPYAVFDWDSALIGIPSDDLAYAVWMWCDIGNEENSPIETGKKAKTMLDAYCLDDFQRRTFVRNIYKQIERVSLMVFPNESQTIETRRWADKCKLWLYENEEQFTSCLFV